MHDRRVIVAANERATWNESERELAAGNSQKADRIDYATLSAHVAEPIFDGTWGEMNEGARR